MTKNPGERVEASLRGLRWMVAAVAALQLAILVYLL
jgi:hypothetical protein